MIDADTRLVVATARPAPGNKANAQVWRACDLPAQCEGATVLGDGAYLNTGLAVPHRKRGNRVAAHVSSWGQVLDLDTKDISGIDVSRLTPPR